MKIKEIIEWLDEEIQGALEAAKESSDFAMNSYGAGQDYGEYMGLLKVKEYLSTIETDKPIDNVEEKP